jgi:hypothetical protein
MRVTADFSRFDDVVADLESVRQVLREPMSSVVAQQIDHLDDVCKAIIAKSRGSGSPRPGPMRAAQPA